MALNTLPTIIFQQEITAHNVQFIYKVHLVF